MIWFLNSQLSRGGRRSWQSRWLPSLPSPESKEKKGEGPEASECRSTLLWEQIQSEGSRLNLAFLSLGALPWVKRAEEEALTIQ